MVASSTLRQDGHLLELGHGSPALLAPGHVHQLRARHMGENHHVCAVHSFCDSRFAPAALASNRPDRSSIGFTPINPMIRSLSPCRGSTRSTSPIFRVCGAERHSLSCGYQGLVAGDLLRQPERGSDVGEECPRLWIR